jgi:2-polyprenyl-3-methyl-5-hydroxy-6-metoxy-1,4-benzoquinol methylase
MQLILSNLAETKYIMTTQQSPLRYTFKPGTVCEMCGDSIAGHKILGQRLNKSLGLSPRKKSGISVSVKRCKKCGLIYSDPQPIPESIQDHYNVPPETYWEKAYFNWDESYFLPQINRAKLLLNFRPGMKSLDIGSGIGIGVVALAKAGFDSYGLEPSEAFYSKSIESTEISAGMIRFSSIENAEYDDNSFDFISMKAVAEHLYTPSASIAKAIRWLKPGGVVYIEVPSTKYFITRLIDLYFKSIGTTYTSHLSPMHEPYHLFEFSLKSFSANTHAKEYDIVHYEYDVCDILFFPKILHPLVGWYMKTTNSGMDLHVWLRKK